MNRRLLSRILVIALVVAMLASTVVTIIFYLIR